MQTDARGEKKKHSYIVLDEYGILVAWAGLHVLRRRQKSVLENIAINYHLELSVPVLRQLTGNCIRSVLIRLVQGIRNESPMKSGMR